MTGTGKTFTKHYTMVELLVVISIVGILLAAALSSFPGLFGKQGLVGSVRALSTKVSMARSYAVTQSYSVALLMPDKTSNTTSGIGTDVAKYIYNYSRICNVSYNVATSKYEFDSWIDGQEWTQIANGTCAYIESSSGYSINKIENIKESPSSTAYNSSAIVFQSNGSLTTSDKVVIRVIPAVYTKNDADYTLTVNVNIIDKKRWNISINSFTGKATYLYGKE